jgi:hypothetical protein
MPTAMPLDEFIGYVGESDFHDGHVLSVDHTGAEAIVRVQGGSGQEFLCTFEGVTTIRANRPVGMMLYALSELRAVAPLRRFVFANGDEDDDASLEIQATSVRVSKTAGQSPAC